MKRMFPIIFDNLNKFVNQSQIKQLLTLSNCSISVFTQTLSQSDKDNVLLTSERCTVYVVT